MRNAKANKANKAAKNPEPVAEAPKAAASEIVTEAKAKPAPKPTPASLHDNLAASTYSGPSNGLRKHVTKNHVIGAGPEHHPAYYTHRDDSEARRFFARYADKPFTPAGFDAGLRKRLAAFGFLRADAAAQTIAFTAAASTYLAANKPLAAGLKMPGATVAAAIAAHNKAA